VIIEGMKLGKVVVGADRGSVPELIQNGVTGLIYRHSDPDSLADVLARVIDTPDDYARMAREASRTASEKFSLPRFGHDLARTIDGAL
jgi:glycosyltransferase involved in cell wall biosynthesis